MSLTDDPDALCEYCEQNRATMWSDEGKRQCPSCAPPGVSHLGVEWVCRGKSVGAGGMLHKISDDYDLDEIEKNDVVEAACGKRPGTSSDAKAKPSSVFPPGYCPTCDECFPNVEP